MTMMMHHPVIPDDCCYYVISLFGSYRYEALRAWKGDLQGCS